MHLHQSISIYIHRWLWRSCTVPPRGLRRSNGQCRSALLRHAGTGDPCWTIIDVPCSNTYDRSLSIGGRGAIPHPFLTPECGNVADLTDFYPYQPWSWQLCALHCLLFWFYCFSILMIHHIHDSLTGNPLGSFSNMPCLFQSTKRQATLLERQWHSGNSCITLRMNLINVVL